MSAQDAVPRAGTQGNGNIIGSSRSVPQHSRARESSSELRADEFAPLTSRRRTVPIATTAELLARFERIDERRRKVWRPCLGCETPVAVPKVVCDICAEWTALFAELDRIRRSIGAQT